MTTCIVQTELVQSRQILGVSKYIYNNLYRTDNNN
jgi:hypothetical protein